MLKSLKLKTVSKIEDCNILKFFENKKLRVFDERVGDLDESGNGGGFGGLCNHQQAKANSLKFLQIISIIILQNYYLLVDQTVKLYDKAKALVRKCQL